MTKLVTLLAAALAVALTAASAAIAAPAVDGEFGLPHTPNRVAPGLDGNMWVTLQGANEGVAKVTPDGTVTPYTSADFQSPVGIVAAPDGTMWVTQSNAVVKFSPANPTATTLFAVDIVQAQSMTVGPDGNLWTASADKIFKIPPATGVEQTFPGIVQGARGIASGSDGRIWIVDFATQSIFSLTTDGVTATPHPVGSGNPQEVAAGPGGQVAYTSPSNEIGRLTNGAAGLQTATPGADPFGVTLGIDQAYWTAQFATNNIGRLTTDGQYTTLPGLTAGSGPRHIAAGPNNTIWVTLETTKKIARVSGLEPPDTTTPVVSGLSLSAKIFRVGRSQTPAIAKRVPVGTKIRFTLSEAATVTLKIERASAGRRSAGKCVRPRKSLRRKRKCTRYTTAGTLTRTGPAGANSVSFSGRIGRKALKPGAYRVVVTAVDAAGNTGTPVSRSFRIKSRG